MVVCVSAGVCVVTESDEAQKAAAAVLLLLLLTAGSAEDNQSIERPTDRSSQPASQPAR